jgi:hydroxymethylglutaryl-CoA lyase
MADSSSLFKSIPKTSHISYPVLAPNMKGYQSALDVGVKEIAVFAAASETFSKKNVNCSIEDSFTRFKMVVDQALKDGLKIRGYVSCVVGCPYEGQTIKPTTVVKVAERLLDMGCYEVSLGDTIGVQSNLTAGWNPRINWKAD